MPSNVLRNYNPLGSGEGNVDPVHINTGRENLRVIQVAVPFKHFHVTADTSVNGQAGADAAKKKRDKIRFDRIMARKPIVSYLPETPAQRDRKAVAKTTKARLYMRQWRATWPNVNSEHWRPKRTIAQTRSHAAKYMCEYMRQRRAGVVNKDMQSVLYPKVPKRGYAGFINYVGEEQPIGPRPDPALCPWLFGRPRVAPY